MNFLISIRGLQVFTKFRLLVTGRLKMDSPSFLLSLAVSLSLLMITSAISWHLLKNRQNLTEMVKWMMDENQRLTNLLTSKDPMTFSTLQTLTTSSSHSPVASLDIANDDISVAKRLAESYERAGIDPAAAYDDPEIALQDFDLRQFGL